MQWVRIAAFVQEKLELAMAALHYVRRRFLVPLALRGGRDMLLLRNGQWIDTLPSIPTAQVAWRYDSTAHQLHQAGAAAESRLGRWPWISVANQDHDLSDFFADLRITAGQTLSKDKAFMLYAHQRGHLPHGTVTIMKRDGTEEIIHTYEDTTPADGSGSVSSASQDVNFVR
jgi:hypothetical protein